MKWQGLQAHRADQIRAFDGSLFGLIRALSYIALAAGITTVIAGIFISVSSALIAVAVVLLAPGIMFASLSLYFSYLKANPQHLLTNELKPISLLNSFDYESLLLIRPLVKDGKWGGFWDQAYRNNNIAEVFYRLKIDKKTATDLCGGSAATDDVSAVIERIVAYAGNRLVTQYDVVAVLLEKDEYREFLKEEKLDPETVKNFLSFCANRHNFDIQQRSFWLHKNVTQKTGGFAKDWSVSYTTVLDRFAGEEDLRFLEARAHLFPLFSRESMVGEIIQDLNKMNGQNVALVGEPGTGKMEILHHVGYKIRSYQTKTELDGKSFRVLDVEDVLNAAGSIQKAKGLLEQIFSDIIRSEQVVLLIKNVEELLGENENNFTVLFNTFLQDSRIHMIVPINQETLTLSLKSNPDLLKNFSIVDVSHPANSDLPLIVFSHLARYERRYGVFFLCESIIEIVHLAEQYLKHEYPPQRELSLLEDVAAYAHGINKSIVTNEIVAQVAQKQTGIPIVNDAQSQQKVLGLQSELRSRIVGQDDALQHVSDALLRARAGLSASNRPIGSFLFLGPTGVGKTQTAKALAESYFGGSDKMIRLDMSEYSDSSALEKLLGADPSRNPGSLTVAIEEKPSSVVLLDELEKASEQIRNAFLQVVDEGRLTTNFGRVLDFTSTIIIATSNAGSDFIKAQIEAGRASKDFEKQLVDGLISSRIFSAEFLNRFDGVVIFSPLTKEQVGEVVKIQVEELKKRILKEKNITLEVADSVFEELAVRGYDPVFGARALQRVIKNDLETKIAKELFAHQLDSGATLSIDALN
jgi:ATP-dependent Clp protease ATP-binding subunit ClpC